MWSDPISFVTIDQQTGIESSNKRAINSIVASSDSSFVSAMVGKSRFGPSSSSEEGTTPYVVARTLDIAAVASTSCTNAEFYDTLSTPWSVTSVAVVTQLSSASWHHFQAMLCSRWPLMLVQPMSLMRERLIVVS